jgi:DnaJ-class molecular chaperone
MVHKDSHTNVDWTAELNQPTSKPYCCPVCGGRGLVPQGFYTAIGVHYFSATNTAPEKCRTCFGSGYIVV